MATASLSGPRSAARTKPIRNAIAGDRAGQHRNAGQPEPVGGRWCPGGRGQVQSGQVDAAGGVAEHDHRLSALPVQRQHGVHPAGSAVVPGDLPPVHLAGVPGQSDLAVAGLGLGSSAAIPGAWPARTAAAKAIMSWAVDQVEDPAGTYAAPYQYAARQPFSRCARTPLGGNFALGRGEGGRGHPQRGQQPLLRQRRPVRYARRARLGVAEQRHAQVGVGVPAGVLELDVAGGRDQVLDRDVVRIPVAQHGQQGARPARGEREEARSCGWPARRARRRPPACRPVRAGASPAGPRRPSHPVAPRRRAASR